MSKNQSMKEYLSGLSKEKEYSKLFAGSLPLIDYIDLKTNLLHNQTLEERSRLEKIAEDIGAKISVPGPEEIPSNFVNGPNRLIRKYVLTLPNEERFVTIYSEKEIRMKIGRRKKYKPSHLNLEISTKINEKEKVKKLLDLLQKNFKLED